MSSHWLARLEQNTAGDLHAAVGLQLQRIQRLPGNALGVDDVNALDDRAVRDARLAEVKTLVAVERGITVADHRHEDVGFRGEFLNGRRRTGIGGRRIAAAGSIRLGTDYSLRRGCTVH